MEHKYLVAIEIGSSKIKGAVGSVDESGTLKVNAIEERNLVDCVRHGCIQNVEEVRACVDDIIRSIENRANISPCKVKGVYVALGGRSVMSYKHEVERAFDTETAITGEIIGQMIDDTRLVELNEKVIVDVMPMEFMVDNKVQQTPIGTYGHNLKASFNIIACRPQLVKNIDRVIEERLQLDINGYIVRQIALSQLVLSSEDKKLGCVLVDFGAETTTISIHKKDALQYMATLPIGSRNITRDLTALNITEEMAERLKCQYANAYSQETAGQGGRSTIIEGVDDAEFNNYVQCRVGEIAFNIVSQIKQAGFKEEDFAKGGIVVVGQGSKMQGFNKVLGYLSSLNVRTGIVSKVQITDGSIRPDDALDVISILLAASKESGAKNCIERKYEEPQEEIVISSVVENEPISEPVTEEVSGNNEVVETPTKIDPTPRPKKESAASKLLRRIQENLKTGQGKLANFLKEGDDDYED